MESGSKDREYMKMALSLAAKGKGMTHPNPMVGAVLVKKGDIMGSGYHKGPGKPHAEIEALEQAGVEAAGADLYVTLEPCNHYGRTPPCTEAILKSGVRRVVFAAKDPNPSVAGGGEQRLREAGIEVRGGILAEKASRLNEAYEKLALTGKPLVTIKAAVTADGKIATRGGASKWITSEKARRAVHRMRRECDAVVVGRGTVDIDDPELTVRMVRLGGARPPMRVVVDSRISMSLQSRLAQGGDPQVIVAATKEHDREKAEELRSRGVKVLELGDKDGRVDLEELLLSLGGMGAAHVMVEGGPTLTTSFLLDGLADRLALFVAPKVFGDNEARSWVEGCIIEDPSHALDFRWRRATLVGDDIFLEAEVGKR
jgi:diaminohydroxyphosphoribosylaminopyrimidine deaminase/5-amino-6-(5-phosphoribosylamino)uracil reductase